LSSLWEGNPVEPFETARELILCSVNAEDRPAAEQYALRAIDLLRKAVEKHYDYINAIRTDPAFNPLRSRPSFHAFLADAAFPADPFAR
jgi:hypothetical protein